MSVSLFCLLRGIFWQHLGVLEVSQAALQIVKNRSTSGRLGLGYGWVGARKAFLAESVGMNRRNRWTHLLFIYLLSSYGILGMAIQNP